MRMTHFLSVCLTMFAMVACGNQAGRQVTEGQVGNDLQLYKRTLHYLTDMGISPDTLMLPECVNYPVFSDTVSHSHWLTADEAVTLGMKQLCGVDADGTPAVLLGVDIISDQVTMLLYQVYYGDKSPVVLVTYDTDGVVMDMLPAGTWAGVNTLYANEHGDAMDLGVDSAVMSLKDNGEFIVDHYLTMVQRPTGGGNSMQQWQYNKKSSYRVDPVVGLFEEYDSEVRLPEVTNDDVVRRELEMLSWAPLQDEEVMARYDAFAQRHATELSGQSFLSTLYAFALFDRLDLAPWSMLEWLYEHQDSRVYSLFIDAVNEHQLDQDRLLKAVKTVQDPKAKQYWRKQFKLK